MASRRELFSRLPSGRGSARLGEISRDPRHDGHQRLLHERRCLSRTTSFTIGIFHERHLTNGVLHNQHLSRTASHERHPSQSASFTNGVFTNGIFHERQQIHSSEHARRDGQIVSNSSSTKSAPSRSSNAHAMASVMSYDTGRDRTRQIIHSVLSYFSSCDVMRCRPRGFDQMKRKLQFCARKKKKRKKRREGMKLSEF